jgi:hypothetical protein
MQNDDLVYYLGEEAVCYFDFTLIKEIWHVKILLINEVEYNTREPYWVPYSAISLKNDPGEKKKTGYLNLHLKDLEKKKEKEAVLYQKNKPPVRTKLVSRNRDLEKNLRKQAILFPN